MKKISATSTDSNAKLKAARKRYDIAANAMNRDWRIYTRSRMRMEAAAKALAKAQVEAGDA